MPWQALVQMEEILFMADRNFKAHPPAWRPPPLHLEAAAAYHIIVSICQMMAMGPKGLCAVLMKSEIREGSVFRSLGII